MNFYLARLLVLGALEFLVFTTLIVDLGLIIALLDKGWRSLSVTILA